MPIPRPGVLIVSGAVLVLLVFALSLIYFGAVPISPLSPAKKTAILPACPAQKEGNPLVSEVAKTGEIATGTLKGKIEKIDLSPTGKEGVFEIASLGGKQTHIFGVEEKEGLVFDSINSKTAQLADLKVGHTVSVDFSCNPMTAQEGVLNDFAVARIVILGQ